MDSIYKNIYYFIKKNFNHFGIESCNQRAHLKSNNRQSTKQQVFTHHFQFFFLSEPTIFNLIIKE